MASLPISGRDLFRRLDFATFACRFIARPALPARNWSLRSPGAATSSRSAAAPAPCSASYPGDARITAIQPDADFAARARGVAAARGRAIEVGGPRRGAAAGRTPRMDAAGARARPVLGGRCRRRVPRACARGATRAARGVPAFEHAPAAPALSPARRCRSSIRCGSPRYGQGRPLQPGPVARACRAGLRITDVTPFQILVGRGLPASPDAAHSRDAAGELAGRRRRAVYPGA